MIKFRIILCIGSELPGDLCERRLSKLLFGLLSYNCGFCQQQSCFNACGFGFSRNLTISGPLISVSEDMGLTPSQNKSSDQRQIRLNWNFLLKQIDAWPRVTCKTIIIRLQDRHNFSVPINWLGELDVHWYGYDMVYCWYDIAHRSC